MSTVRSEDRAGTRRVRNVLFIMADQLRVDYLSCYGHPQLKTPHIDALAARGVRFTQCHVQAPVCGPSRMSTYTGRYVASHGSTWNFVPLDIATPTMGDHLREAGMRVAVVGKTHIAGDRKGMARLGIDIQSAAGKLLDEGGFEPYARHDGALPDAKLAHFDPPYNRYLKSLGYPAHNAWHDFANSAVDANGNVLSGWQLRHSSLPARVADAHSETAWTTDKAIEFIKEQAEAPWCLHVSYIKPHWPYMVSAPYHQVFDSAQVQKVNRHTRELDGANPVVQAFRQHPESLAFSRDEVRATVIPTYMGLVQQLDDHVGRLMRFMQEAGRMDDTLIVFTSDHGDLLGDHWLGEKEMFYDVSVRVPLIVVDPTTTPETQVCHDLVESIDLLPTFLDAAGLDPANPWLEGHSLLPYLRGKGVAVRDATVSELDYAFYGARRSLGLGVNEARATMIRTARWKYVRFEGFDPQLFDLENDPQELVDLGKDNGLATVRLDMESRLSRWRANCRNRTTMSDAEVLVKGDRTKVGGVRIGEW